MWKEFLKMRWSMDKYKILVKGIVKHEDKYLIVKRWYDDRISEPFQWEFVDGTVQFGEPLEKAVLRNVADRTGIDACISQVMYTWTFMVGEVCNIGVAFLCMTAIDHVTLSEDLLEYKWITKDEFADYIENKNVLKDIQKALLA